VTLLTTPTLRALFDPSSRIQRMLDVEAALARAEARVGVIPHDSVAAIEACCKAELYDIDAIEEAAWNAGNLAIPLVAALTKRVGECSATARGFVHWGATSQDIIDTGLVLQLREALDETDDHLARLVQGLVEQVERHRGTVLSGRTWLQQGVPVTLGLKLAGVLAAVGRDRERLAAARRRALVLQFGGATGTLASLGAQGPAVQAALGEELQLPVPPTPWHTQRDSLCELASALGVIAATLGKLARDLALLGQTEVGEASEPSAPGRGGSSTMPQKRNPVGASVALCAAVRVPGLVATMLSAAVQEHERGLGNWPAEWDTLPEIVQATAGALASMADVVGALEVDAAQMRRNLDISRGQNLAEAVQMALAPKIGRDVAHKLVADAAKRATREGRHLKDVLADDAKVREVLDPAALDRLFDPAHYLGATQVFIDRVLESVKGRSEGAVKE
jgi:3-carboxy-cis,cis-muconate cycloisomerase